MKPLDPSCYNEHLLELQQVQELLANWLLPVSETETVPLAAAFGRILASPVYAPQDQPLHPTAAMDGYALKADDQQPLRELVGAAFAGHPAEHRVAEGQAMRIMTGAWLPEGANAVIMQEQTELVDGRLRLLAGVSTQQNVRQIGEEQRQGDLLLPLGTRIGAIELGLLASIGSSRIRVRRRLKVAYFSTGDELQVPGQPLAPGEIYDSNGYMLGALLQQLGVQPIDLGRVADDPAALRETLLNASAQADLILSSGGVSVGEADYVQQLLTELGQVGFWKLAIKPGKPLAFGRIGQAYFFGLPGNPVSAAVTFYQVVQPALRQLMGQTPGLALELSARLTENLRKKAGRLEFVRGLLQRDAQQQWSVQPLANQGSARLASLTDANCFIWFDKDAQQLKAGDWVKVQPFAGLMA